MDDLTQAGLLLRPVSGLGVLEPLLLTPVADALEDSLEDLRGMLLWGGGGGGAGRRRRWGRWGSLNSW